jgi:hypothetical protein
MEIILKSRQIPNDDLIQKLEAANLGKEDVHLLLRKRDQSFRSLDPTVVIAIVTAASTALGALITGMLNIAKESKSQSIVVQDKHGHRIEFPANCSKEKTEEIICLLNQMEAPRIEIP